MREGGRFADHLGLGGLSQINRRGEFLGFEPKPTCIISFMRDIFCITPEELFSKYSLDTVDPAALTSEQLGPWVYFIRAKGLGVIKIGFTSNIRSRLTRITDCPAPLELLAVMDGGLKAERAIHEKFARYRRHLEWFEESAELVMFIQSLPELDCGPCSPAADRASERIFAVDENT